MYNFKIEKNMFYALKNTVKIIIDTKTQDCYDLWGIDYICGLKPPQSYSSYGHIRLN